MCRGIQYFICLFGNGLYARDTSKKIRAVFKAKGQSGKPLSSPPYGYKKSEIDKNVWEIDEEAAEVVRKIFQLCIAGNGPTKIARILTEEGIPTPTAHAKSKGRNAGHPNAKLHRWGEQTIDHILEKAEYAGHTVNFRTRIKSYKNKKQIRNPKSEWAIFENTHERLFLRRILIWCRSYARTNTEYRNAESSIHFQEWFTVLTAERRCIFAGRKVLIQTKSI